MEAILEALYQNQAGITEAQSILWLLFLDYGLVFGGYLVLVAMDKVKEKVNFTLLIFLTLMLLAIIAFYKGLGIVSVYVVTGLFITAMFISFRKIILLPLTFVIFVICEFVAMKFWIQPYDLLITIFLFVLGLLVCGMVIRAIYDRSR